VGNGATKLWDKGYTLDREIEEYTVGNDYSLDLALVRYDCRASIAHAQMLGKIGVLTKKEVASLAKALNEIIELDGKGKFSITKSQEDCHTAIENYLTKRLGKLGKKIHTGRSRNDQVLAALRLYYKAELRKCSTLTLQLIGTLTKLGNRYRNVRIPGYTHTRKAMPSSIKLWSSAFADALRDDLKLIDVAYDLVDQSPLGSGAGYGVPMAVDRRFVANKLGFSKVQGNPIYVQESRGKFESTMIHALSQVMLDINKMSQDLIIFSMPEFGYFVLPREFLTGSSMMPHKSNPDVLELLRANYHVVVSYESMVKGLVSNLISGYNRDLQLTKEPVMRSLEVSERSLSVMNLVMGRLEVDKERCAAAMTDELYATDKAYRLMGRGKAFRDAYREVAERYKR
jgi:argininosuccinate lyase